MVKKVDRPNDKNQPLSVTITDASLAIFGVNDQFA